MHCKGLVIQALLQLSHIIWYLIVYNSCAGFGAAYGTAKSGVGIASMGVMRPELVMKSIVPVVMAGVLGIYGLIIAVIISTGSASPCLPPSNLPPGRLVSRQVALGIAWYPARGLCGGRRACHSHTAKGCA